MGSKHAAESTGGWYESHAALCYSALLAVAASSASQQPARQTWRSTMKKAILLVFMLSVSSGSARAQEADVRRLITGFITALQNLDWPAFRECWAENPVVYGPESAARSEGPSFESGWLFQFQRMREAAVARGVTSAPYTIDPQDLRIDFPDPTVAVVTFHLTNATRTSSRGPIVGRRMFVVARTASGWKITHLNNSDVAPRQ